MRESRCHQSPHPALSQVASAGGEVVGEEGQDPRVLVLALECLTVRPCAKHGAVEPWDGMGRRGELSSSREEGRRGRTDDCIQDIQARDTIDALSQRGIAAGVV